jgi:hypothetical protein
MERVREREGERERERERRASEINVASVENVDEVVGGVMLFIGF